MIEMDALPVFVCSPRVAKVPAARMATVPGVEPSTWIVPPVAAA